MTHRATKTTTRAKREYVVCHEGDTARFFGDIDNERLFTRRDAEKYAAWARPISVRVYRLVPTRKPKGVK